MDTTSLDRLHRVVEHIRSSVRHDIPLSQLTVYLTVCRQPGITMLDIQEDLDMLQGSLSKITKQLSRYSVKGEIKGYDLVRTEPDLEDRRRMAVHLTQKGSQLRREIVDILTSGGGG